MKKIESILFMCGAFIVINAPSLKILYSSELINIAGFLMIVMGFFIRISFGTIVVNKKKIINLSMVTLFFIFIILSILWAPQAIRIRVLVQFLSVYLSFLFLYLGVQKEELHIYLRLQIFWSLLLAILHFNGFVTLNYLLGQHYLTVGLPLGLGFVQSVGMIIKDINEKKMGNVFTDFIIMAIIFIDLISLRGRSPVLMSILVIYVFGLLILFFENNKWRNIIFLISLTFLIIYLLNNFGRELLIERFITLFENTEEESRTHIFKTAIGMIMANPLGYGMNSFSFYTNYGYPHNIILESTLYGGIQATIFLLPVVINILFNTIVSVKKKVYSEIIISMITLYVLLIWNISYDLTSSYVLFSIIALQFVSVEKY